MDLEARLDRYEVTALPKAAPRLALVWSEPDEPTADERGATFGALALLDDYRITRVPGRVAS